MSKDISDMESAAASSGIPDKVDSKSVEKGLSGNPELDSLTEISERLASLNESMRLTDEAGRSLDLNDLEAVAAHKEAVQSEMVMAKDLSDAISDLSKRQNGKKPGAPGANQASPKIKAGNELLDRAWLLIMMLLEKLFSAIKQRTLSPNTPQRAPYDRSKYVIGVPVQNVRIPRSNGGKKEEITQKQLLGDVGDSIDAAAARENSLKLAKEAQAGLDGQENDGPKPKP